MKYPLYIFAGIFAIHSLWIAIIEKSDIPIISFSAMITLLFIANLERIKNFKVSSDGVEAETREVINKAREITKEMKYLAQVLVENQITTIQRTMRMGGYTDKEKEERKEALLQTLRDIELPEEEIQKALKEWNLFEEFDYAVGLLNSGNVPIKLGEEVLKDWRVISDKLNIESPPSPQEIRNFFVKHSLLSEEAQKRIDDYEYYIINKKHRRPKDFATRDKWRIKPSTP